MASKSKKSAKPARTDAPTLLECRGVTVLFGGLAALMDVDLEVRDGEIVALIGPNGAGKTTLMECISGFQPVFRGAISYRGENLLRHAPGDRAKLGIGRTLQNVRLFPYLTIVDNLRVALHRHTRSNPFSEEILLPSTRNEERRILDRAVHLVAGLGMQAFAEKFASEPAYGTLRLLEMATICPLEPTLFLL